MSETSPAQKLSAPLKRSGIVLVVAIAGCACEDRPPILPAAPSTTAPVAPPPGPVAGPTRIAGRVLDTLDAPVSGATLTFNTPRGRVGTTSDATGSFDVTVEPFIYGLDVLIEKPAYERTIHWIGVPSSGEVVRNLRLHPILRVAAGDSLRLSIRPDDPFCGFDLEFLCRTVRIVSAAAGRLTGEVIPDRASTQVGLGVTSELFPKLGARLSLEITANSETLVNVLVWWQVEGEQSLTLNTSLDR